jgi:hypothetical protein
LRYHADFAIPKIIKGGLRPGYKNAYTDEPAIYCSPNFEFVLRDYSRPIEE